MAPQPPQAPQPAFTPVPVLVAARRTVTAVITAVLVLWAGLLIAAALTHQPWLAMPAFGLPASVGCFLLPHLSGVRLRGAAPPPEAPAEPPAAA